MVCIMQSHIMLALFFIKLFEISYKYIKKDTISLEDVIRKQL